jgi:hypothetical protein
MSETGKFLDLQGKRFIDMEFSWADGSPISKEEISQEVVKVVKDFLSSTDPTIDENSVMVCASLFLVSFAEEMAKTGIRDPADMAMLLASTDVRMTMMMFLLSGFIFAKFIDSDGIKAKLSTQPLSDKEIEEILHADREQENELAEELRNGK